MSMKGSDIMNMSDEDFLNNPPDDFTAESVAVDPAALSPSGSEPEGTTLDTVDDTTPDDPDVDHDNENGDGDDPDDPDLDDPADPDAAGKGDEGKADPAADPAKDKGDGKPSDPTKENGKPEEDKEPPAQAPADGAVTELKPEEYRAFFDQVMKPFKANGREVKLKSPDEAIRLMQMGAGFGRKLQDLQPHLKTLRMLEKNGLMDEDKLSFLIDVNQKNPEAIKKLLKDSGIDPLDLNMEDNAQYVPRNHSVSDAEMAFKDTLAEVATHPTGKETIRIVNQTWDQASKDMLWKSPELLKVIQTQRENGIYDQIVAEIDRQKMMGYIPASTPHLHAYKMAGDALVKASGLQIPSESQTPLTPNSTNAAPSPSLVPGQQQSQPRVLATKAAAPKQQVSNGARAKAAATPQTTPRKAAPVVNPLEMSDEDFLKTFEGRL